jgi:hypothetical protein
MTNSAMSGRISRVRSSRRTFAGRNGGELFLVALIDQKPDGQS